MQKPLILTVDQVFQNFRQRTGGNTSGNLFTLAEAQYSRCTTALRWRNTP